ncbi:MAG: YgiQ family radical SAM protein, partial [Candidatus Kapaibacterium sp.]
MKRLGWERPDVVIVSGDTYLDSPYSGSAIIGHWLMAHGFRVGIIAQPDIDSPDDITRLGEPLLFWGVTAGSVDSMVANYTALRKRKKSDDMTPGETNDRRPDRATIKYTNLIRQYFKNTAPIVLGGVEASLRRIAHYDFWTDSIRRSVLFDAKADYIAYGMAEQTTLELARALASGEDPRSIRGLCYISNDYPDEYLQLPDYEACKADDRAFEESFLQFYKNTDPLNSKGLCQKHAGRWLVQNPPNYYLNQEDLDKVNELDYEYRVHPYYKKIGNVPGEQTVKFSINSHRGCFGECNFCAIAVHQGRTIRSRSEKSILREAKTYSKMKDFRGNIYDVGGPTANMYAMECKVQQKKGSCRNKRCAFPDFCESMNIDHAQQTALLRKIRQLPKVKNVFLGSGVRYDLIMADDKSGRRYLKDVIDHHISGQMKIAPEHADAEVLKAMGKPPAYSVAEFKQAFDKFNKIKGKQQFLTYYFIAGHPGCDLKSARELRRYISKHL